MEWNGKGAVLKVVEWNGMEEQIFHWNGTEWKLKSAQFSIFSVFTLQTLMP